MPLINQHVNFRPFCKLFKPNSILGKHNAFIKVTIIHYQRLPTNIFKHKPFQIFLSPNVQIRHIHRSYKTKCPLYSSMMNYFNRRSILPYFLHPTHFEHKYLKHALKLHSMPMFRFLTFNN